MTEALSVVVGGDGSGLALSRTLDSLATCAHVEVLLAPTPHDDVRRAALWESAAQRGSGRLVDVAPGMSWRDAGLRAAARELVFVLSPGDRVVAGALDAARERLLSDPDLDFVAGWTRRQLSHHDERLELGASLDLPTLLARPDAAPRAVVMRRALWRAGDGFGDGGHAALEEWGFWIAALAGGARGLLLERPLIVSSRAPAELSGRAAGDLERLFDRHRPAFETDPAALLEAQELTIRRIVARHDRLAARRAAAAAELERLGGETQALQRGLVALGEDAVDWGDLGAPAPLSRDWGYDRGGQAPGRPVDRHYVERFLEACAEDVQGAVLEVQEDDYTRRFGGGRVTRSDVVDVDPANARATLLADLCDARAIPDETYDCFILTQTLHVLDDAAAALREAHRILKPGGVLLATLPCSSRVCLEYGADGDFWRITEAGARRLVGAAFPADRVETRAWGNVLSSAAFLYGAACDELSEEQLDAFDPYLPLLVSVRAVKAGGDPPARLGARRRARARPAPAPTTAPVLLYHRIAEPALDVHGLCVSPADFAEQMEVLREDWDPVPLEVLAAAAARGERLDGAVAVTLDDGYADALHEASPVLTSLGIPATFFVTGGPSEPFWWDVLESVLYGPAPVPPELELELEGERVALPTASRADRRAAHDRLHGPFVRASREERQRLVTALVSWSGRVPRPQGRPLDAGELKRLAARPGHAIGAHTVAHLALSHQSPEVVREEVRGGRAAVEGVLGRPATAFAYPYGDVSEAAVAAAQAAGFRVAVTCEPRPVASGDAALRIPRLEPGPGGREAFRRRLRDSVAGAAS